MTTIKAAAVSPGVRLRRLGFAPTQLGGGLVGWCARRTIAGKACEILITDGEGSWHLPVRGRDHALLTICAEGESEHWLSLAMTLPALCAALERGEMIAPSMKKAG